MAYIVGGFGSAFLLSYLIIYKGLEKNYFNKYKGFEKESKKRIYFLILVIVFSILIIAAENTFR